MIYTHRITIVRDKGSAIWFLACEPRIENGCLIYDRDGTTHLHSPSNYIRAEIAPIAPARPSRLENVTRILNDIRLTLLKGKANGDHVSPKDVFELLGIVETLAKELQ